MDRNYPFAVVVYSSFVALLAEGVDRNLPFFFPLALYVNVALLAEGVDRNDDLSRVVAVIVQSPSSRRAWIEIAAGCEGDVTDLSRPPRGGRG